MAVADDIVASVGRIQAAVSTAVALIGTLKSQVSAVGMTTDQAANLLTTVSAIEKSLSDALLPPAPPA